MANIDIRIRVRGNREVRNALRGIINEQRKAEQSARGQGDRTTRHHRSNERRKKDASLRALREIGRAVERAEREKRRAHERTAREATRHERAKVRAAEKAARESRRAWKRTAAIAGAGVLGAGAGLLSRGQALRGAAGFRSREQRFGEAVQFRQDVIRLGQMSNQDPDRLQSQILGSARRTGVDPAKLLGGAQIAQEKFDDAKGLVENMDAVANLTRAADADMRDAVGTIFEMRRQFKLSSEEVDKLTGVLIEAANRGSVDFAEFAGSFGATLGNVRRGLGEHGQGAKGARDAIVLAELIGTGGGNPQELGTRLERFLESLNDVGTRKRAKEKLGINFTEDDGETLRPIFEILGDLLKSEEFGKASVRQEVFREKRGRIGAEILTQAIQDNPEMFETLKRITPESGKKYVSETMSALDADPSGQIRRQATNEMANYIENSEGLMEHFAAMNEPVGDLVSKFPELAEAATVAKNALMGMGGMAILSNLTGGAGAAGAAGSAARGAAGAASAASGAAASGAASSAARGAAKGSSGILRRLFGKGAGAAGAAGTTGVLGRFGPGVAGLGMREVLNKGIKPLTEDLGNWLFGPRAKPGGEEQGKGGSGQGQKSGGSGDEAEKFFEGSRFFQDGGETPVFELGDKTLRALVEDRQRRGPGGPAHAE